MTTTDTVHNIGMVEAAQILNIPYHIFLGYVRAGLLCYKLEGRERFYSINELNRFRKEVLEK